MVCELTDLLKDIQKDEAIELPLFNEILKNSENLLNMSDVDLAKKFTVSIPTVIKWKNGEDSPHKFIRRPILNFIEEKTKELAEINKKIRVI